MLKKEDIIYINELGINALKSKFLDKNSRVTSEKSDSESTSQKQLVKKDKQIEELQSIIKQTQKLLDQQQQLNAEDKKIIHDLRNQLALEEPKKKKEYDTPEEQEEKLRLIDEKNRYKDEFEQMKRAWEKAESDNVAVIEQNTELREMLEEAENQPKKWYQFWKRSE